MQINIRSWKNSRTEDKIKVVYARCFYMKALKKYAIVLKLNWKGKQLGDLWNFWLEEITDVYDANLSVLYFTEGLPMPYLYINSDPDAAIILNELNSSDLDIFINDGIWVEQKQEN